MRNALRSLFLALAPLGALCAEPRVLEVPEITTVFLSIDGGQNMQELTFSTVAAVSSVAFASRNASQLRFVLALTAPGRAGDEFAAALCEVIRSACGHTLDARADGELPLCASKSFGVGLGDFAADAFEGAAPRETPEIVHGNAAPPRLAKPTAPRACEASATSLPARVTFLRLPSDARKYPPRVAQMLELLCCANRRYSTDRPELARSLGNHARFFAHLALLPLGVRRIIFMDADTLARVDLADLFSAPLTNSRFIGAAKRCATTHAAYQPHFAFKDVLVQSYGLKSDAQHINAGVLLIDLEAYCRADFIGSLVEILTRHVAGPQLWKQGNNQPPFTIAAARRLFMLHPSWNVRPGDAAAQFRIKKRSTSEKGQQCESMVAEQPRILHAHFAPCDALPARLCPRDNRAATRDDGKPLRSAIAHVQHVEAKVASQPCKCAAVPRLTDAPHRRHGHSRHNKKSSSDSKSSDARRLSGHQIQLQQAWNTSRLG